MVIEKLLKNEDKFFELIEVIKKLEIEFSFNNLKEENAFLKSLLQFGQCVYPIYMAVEPIKNILNIELNEKDILDIIQDAKIEGRYFTLEIRINKNDANPTKLISILCMAKILDFLQFYIKEIDNSIEKKQDNYYG